MSNSQAVKKVPFVFDGKDYEIRVTKEGHEYVVQAYWENKPANGYRYTASCTVNIDFMLSKGVFAYDHLVEVAKKDVEERVWEKYLEIMNKPLI